MKSFYFLVFAIVLFSSNKTISSKLILDNLENPGETTQSQYWSFFTDGVMGGLSQGKAIISSDDGIPCYKMTGDVTTENNGGFIQIRTNLRPSIEVKKYEGIYLKVKGNNQKYSVHVRTPLSIAPWQYYSYSFYLEKKWIEIKAPFNKFKRSNQYQPKNLSEQKIKTLGLVAGFNDFYADICLAEIGFY